jgi:hypothetical protein
MMTGVSTFGSLIVSGINYAAGDIASAVESAFAGVHWTFTTLRQSVTIFLQSGGIIGSRDYKGPYRKNETRP